MGATTVTPPFIPGTKPQRPTVGQTRKKTRTMKERAQKRDSMIIQAMKNAHTATR